MSKVSGNEILILQERSSELTDQFWFIFLIFNILISIAYLNTFHRKKMQHYLSALMDNRYVAKIIRDDININSLPFIISSINAVFIFALFTLFSIKLFNLTIPLLSVKPLAMFFEISGIITIAFLLRNLTILLLEFITEETSALTGNRYNMILLGKLTGFILLPLIITLAYLSDIGIKQFLLKVGYGIIIFSFIYRLISSLRNTISQKISRLYIFLYICTLEILPLIVLIKALGDYVH